MVQGSGFFLAVVTVFWISEGHYLRTAAACVRGFQTGRRQAANLAIGEEALF